MKIAMIFWGSRGDVQPGVVLAAELQSRGHDVHFLCPPNYVEFARLSGVNAYATGPDSESHWQTPAAKEFLATRNPVTKIRIAKEHFERGFAELDDDLVARIHDPNGPAHAPDLIIGAPLGQERVYALAEAARVPAVILRYCALSENGIVSPVAGLPIELPSMVNRAAWRAVDQVSWPVLRIVENRFRTRIGLEQAAGSLPQRMRASETVQIQAYDPIFFPGLAEEWGPTKPLVGFLDLPTGTRDRLGEDLSSHRALSAWLEAGPPPVYLGFGSVTASDPDTLVDMIADVCRQEGRRALISVGGSTREITTDDVLTQGAVDHPAVLPRCAAAVHHGGAGTTAASMRAGLPTMICWRGADQAYWGERFARLGAGTSVKLTSLDAKALRENLIALTEPDVAARARAVAAAMKTPAEAVAEATRIVEAQAARTPSYSR